MEIPTNIYGRINAKVQRALRNGTGCQLSKEELVALLHTNIWVEVQKAETRELRETHPRDVPDE